MARKNQQLKELLPQIKEMLESGMTQKEVEQELGLTGDRPIHNLLKRERRKEREIPKTQSGNPVKTLKECEREIERLKMEVEILRDFLLLTERE